MLHSTYIYSNDLGVIWGNLTLPIELTYFCSQNTSIINTKGRGAERVREGGEGGEGGREEK
jgi:hypothetical protein